MQGARRRRRCAPSRCRSLFSSSDGGAGPRGRARRALRSARRDAVDDGRTILILSDRGVDERHAPIPSLLATAAVHHHLIREGTRTRVRPRRRDRASRARCTHFALLHRLRRRRGQPVPRLRDARATWSAKGVIKDVDVDDALKNYIKAIDKGLLKVMIKMGISTLQSYHGAQIFEAIGLNARRHRPLLHLDARRASRASAST